MSESSLLDSVDRKPLNSMLATTDSSGITVSQAMSILSSRASISGERDALQAANPELKKLGQTLDLMNSQQWTNVVDGEGNQACPCGPEADSQLFTSSEKNTTEKSRTSSAKEDDKEAVDKSKSSEVKNELAKQSSSELMKTLLTLQNERVQAFRKFNSGLDIVLESGNLSQYPTLTTSTTASFAVISKHVRNIENILKERGHERISKFIKQLQSFEKEKLNLTAALHLEKIRERNERLVLGDMESDTDKRILLLLEEGVRELLKKVQQCEEDINDILEEIRYETFDLEQSTE